ncbi:MAG: FecR domain-containing protein [Parabacteroides sp.]|nr:FecR domain-containing protein [Parabacteroides sp.]
MKDRSKYEINESLLLRYFNKQVTEEEIGYVEDWIQASEENRKVARDIHYITFAVTTLRNLQSTPSEKALRNVKRKMYRKRSWTLFKTRFQQIAAILFIPLLLSLSYYMLEGKQESPRLIEMRMNPGMTGSVVLPDGTKVWLNSDTYIKYPSTFTSELREVELNGEAYFSVAKEPNRKFIVHSNEDQVEIEVLGTEFNIDAYRDNGFITTTLVSGSVRLSYMNTKNQKHSLLMQPDDRVIYDRTGKFVNKHKADVERDISWRDGTIILKETPLKEVLWTLSKRFNVEFEVRNQRLQSSSFTGIFKNQRLERILEYFKIASHVNYSIHQETGKDGEILKKKVIVY